MVNNQSFCICSSQSLSVQFPAHFALWKPIIANLQKMLTTFHFHSVSLHSKPFLRLYHFFSYIKWPLWLKIWEKPELLCQGLDNKKFTSTNGRFVLNVWLRSNKRYWYLFPNWVLQYPRTQSRANLSKYIAQDRTYRCSFFITIYVCCKHWITMCG